MAVDEDRFPDRIGRGARISIQRKVQVVTLVDGREERNASWRASRRSYDVSFAIRKPVDLAQVIAFHERREGRLQPFRFKDWLDYRSGSPVAAPAATDQALGSGDGAVVQFQLVKRYGDAFGEWIRTIEAPVPGSVLVALDGVEQASGWSVDNATGIVTFDTAPGAGVAVTAGFEFDVPVRFDSDLAAERREFEELGSISSLPLREVRPGDVIGETGSALPPAPAPEVLADMWFSGRRTSDILNPNPVTGLATLSDTEGSFNGGAGSYTVPAAGDWFWSPYIRRTGALNDTLYYVIPKVDGVDQAPDFSSNIGTNWAGAMGGMLGDTYAAGQALSYRATGNCDNFILQGMRVRSSCRWALSKGQPSGAASGKIGGFTPRIDTLGVYDQVNERIVAPARGWYFMALSGRRDQFVALDEGFDVYVNGVVDRSFQHAIPSGRKSRGLISASFVRFLEAGDVVEIYQVNGVRRDVWFSGFNVPLANIELVASLQSVSDPAGSVITGMGTDVDRNNNYDAGVGAYTFDRDGDYLVWVQGRPQPGGGAGYLEFRRNGVSEEVIVSSNPGSQGPFAIFGSRAQIRSFSAGDTCDVYQTTRVWENVSHGIIYLG